MSKLSPIAVALAALALASCTTAGSVTAAEKDASAKDTASTRLTEHGELELLNVTTTPSIDALTFRGTARNPYDEPIEGIRLVMQIRSDPSPASPEMARAQKVMDTKLAPGDHTAFDITVKVTPGTLAQPGFLLQAFAISRGGEKLPLPAIWRE